MLHLFIGHVFIGGEVLGKIIACSNLVEFRTKKNGWIILDTWKFDETFFRIFLPTKKRLVVLFFCREVWVTF